MTKEEEILNKYIAKFIVHLYDTHGYPIELGKEKVIKMNLGDILNLIKGKHRDFIKQRKREYEKNHS